MWNKPALVSLLVLGVLTACASDPTHQANSSSPGVDRNAATWRTWVLTSGNQLRLPPPPDAAATSVELENMRALSVQRDAAVRQRIKYWDIGSPPYRWNDILIDISASSPLPGGGGNRAFAMLNVALNDAMIAAWDSKYAYNRQRPGAMEAGLRTTVLPGSPSYPCEQSVAAGAAAAVIAHLYPKEGHRVNSMAEEAARTRIMSGAAFPSDTKAGLQLGRDVAARVIEHMKVSDDKWAGPVPTGPGLWKGTNPVGVDDMKWKRFVMTSPSQFRPGPPPGHDSSERAAELAEVKDFKRTPMTNGKVSYWQFGQLGGPGLLFRLSEEVGRRLAEEEGNVSAPRAARAYALVHVAHYEGWIASQDAKFHYWTARPVHFDSTVTTVIPTPPFPTYPSNAATLGAAPSVVLTYLFPSEKARYDDWAREFGESRLWAGIHFRSDIKSGWEIGRQVGGAVVARAKADGS